MDDSKQKKTHEIQLHLTITFLKQNYYIRLPLTKFKWVEINEICIHLIDEYKTIGQNGFVLI